MNDISIENKWIGQRTPRPDGIEKVTGSAQYAADFTMSGMVWGKVLRSPHAHALIKKIDTSKADRIEGRAGGDDRRRPALTASRRAAAARVQTILAG